MFVSEGAPVSVSMQQLERYFIYHTAPFILITIP